MTACYQAGSRPLIVLKGFGDENYPKLEKGLGGPVCVRGRIKIDTTGIYFPLKPIESERGTITLSASRIVIDDSAELAWAERVRNGNNDTICGTLADATLIDNCDHNLCKWYRLHNPILQR